jgi:hypothetical protein
MSSDRLEGAADVGPYEAQWQARRRSVPTRSAMLEPLLRRQACGSYARGRQPCLQQWQGWISTGLAPSPNPARSQESKSRVRPAPLRGLGALAVPERAARRHGTGTDHTAQCFPQWRGWDPSWGVGAAVPGREPQAHDGAAPAGVRVLNARVREQAHACRAPSSEADPVRGRSGPSTEAESARGGSGPSNGAEPA